MIKPEFRPVMHSHGGPWEREENEFDAELIPYKAGRSSVMMHSAKKYVSKQFGDAGHLLPLGLHLPESIVDTAEEVQAVDSELLTGTVVVCVGSGTLISGVMLGLIRRQQCPQVVGVTTHHIDVVRKKKQIHERIEQQGELASLEPVVIDLRLINTECQYSDEVDMSIPFPCNSQYDAKAWKWLVEHRGELEEPILFWNIGS